MNAPWICVNNPNHVLSPTTSFCPLCAYERPIEKKPRLDSRKTRKPRPDFSRRNKWSVHILKLAEAKGVGVGFGIDDIMFNSPTGDPDITLHQYVMRGFLDRSPPLVKGEKAKGPFTWFLTDKGHALAKAKL